MKLLGLDYEETEGASLNSERRDFVLILYKVDTVVHQESNAG